MGGFGLGVPVGSTSCLRVGFLVSVLVEGQI